MTATTKIKTGLVRFSYVNVFEPKAASPGAEPKYSVSILIPKTDTKTLDRIKAAISLAKIEGKSRLGKYSEAALKIPLRDGDIEKPDDENYAGCMFVNANSYLKPEVVDIDLLPLSKEEFYSGCYGRASLTFYAYPTGKAPNIGNKGIACGLNNIQKLKDGDRLSGGSTAAQDFGDDDYDDIPF